MTERLGELLTAAQREAGLYLVEEGDFLLLKQGDKVLAVFSQTGATPESIQAEADKYIS